MSVDWSISSCPCEFFSFLIWDMTLFHKSMCYSICKCIFSLAPYRLGKGFPHLWKCSTSNCQVLCHGVRNHANAEIISFQWFLTQPWLWFLVRSFCSFRQKRPPGFCLIDPLPSWHIHFTCQPRIPWEFLKKNHRCVNTCKASPRKRAGDV